MISKKNTLKPPNQYAVFFNYLPLKITFRLNSLANLLPKDVLSLVRIDPGPKYMSYIIWCLGHNSKEDEFVKS